MILVLLKLVEKVTLLYYYYCILVNFLKPPATANKVYYF